MYSMKQACELTGLSYETLKFYCNEGLIPNVQRDSRNYRIFDDRNIKWIHSLTCLKNCGFTLDEMKTYLELCLKGRESIKERQELLKNQRQVILNKMAALQESLDYVDNKVDYYQKVYEGKEAYCSNLIDVTDQQI